MWPNDFSSKRSDILHLYGFRGRGWGLVEEYVSVAFQSVQFEGFIRYHDASRRKSVVTVFFSPSARAGTEHDNIMTIEPLKFADCDADNYVKCNM